MVGNSRVSSTGSAWQVGAWPLLALVGALLIAVPQGASAQVIQKTQAAGASQTLVQVVQQGISSLPPTSPQVFEYGYDQKLGTVVRKPEAGTMVFRDPATFPQGRWSLRFAASYFNIAGSKATGYSFQNNVFDPFSAFTASGISIDANVGVLDFSGVYGVTNWMQVQLGIPVTIVDASLDSVQTKWEGVADPGPVTRTVATEQQLKTLLKQGSVGTTAPRVPPLNGSPQTAVLRNASFNRVTANPQLHLVNDGTQVGLGRISLGSKMQIPDLAPFWLALEPEVLLPSPSEAEYAGPDSAALGARVLARYDATDYLRFIVNAGYEWDTENTTLTRFNWAAGLSWPTEWVTFDYGASGSVYQNGIQWGPRVAETIGSTDDVATRIVALDPNDLILEDNFVNVLFGFKIPLGESYALGGAAVIPVTNVTFQADALGTVSLEAYF